MMRTQILVQRWGRRTRIWRCFTDRLNQGLVLSTAQAMSIHKLKKYLYVIVAIFVLDQ